MIFSENLRRLGKALGIERAHYMHMNELIRAIRLLEGELPCFSQAWSTPCNVEDCPHGLACSSKPC
jgi:hypothetical protein